ncbi:MAG: DUF2892 domain-containing protein [Bacteroidetes bacterium]|nr:MAG: DUF2892 domain-containing protein [Bacteroidota bacterium]
MKKNMGQVDRILRIVIAVLIGALWYMDKIEGTLATVLLVIGAVFLVTALVGTCPLYSALGISTSKGEG